ncbi:hypothetical protein I6G82_04150 [Lysinibacillus macroides]|uniref:Uncharacterized protein n=1 Tax=Lysinibacillus macroides TaxID=33935 RepID=A0A0N0CV20_9BACI|nr:hypothetical protein [Lysinibacillus macroides]KOY81021.1 hypothetical protein ADM90_17830 [Lysinibacillus macroides]QPR68831.1 hypothetical protein I6G82_04150 [Lysinibacillus macroides]
MEIQVIRDHLDIVKLQEKMNTIVFDYLDTSNNYPKAMRELNPLYKQATTFYKDYVEKQAGELPSANTYWHLFIDCYAKLCYFLAISMYYSSNALQKTPEQVEQLLKVAAYSLPNIDQEENDQLVTTIFALLKEVMEDEEKVATIRHEVLAQKGDTKQCLLQLKVFVDHELTFA